MDDRLLTAILLILAAGFAVAFGLIVLPPLLASRDVAGAIAAGFVNPYASAYSLDAVLSWCVLAAWVVYEARVKDVKHGWIALLLGVMPGVTVGFAVYLLLRMHQLRSVG